MPPLATRLALDPMPRLAAVLVGIWATLAAAGGIASERDGATGGPAPPLSPPPAVESGRDHVGLQGTDRGVGNGPQYDSAGNPGIGAPTQQGGQAAPAGASDELLRMQGVLATRGWLLRWDSAGNIYLIPKAAGSAPGSATADSPAPGAPGAAELHRLQELLGPANWRVAQDSAGNILLFPSPRGSDALPSHRDVASAASREAVVEPHRAQPAADSDRAPEPGAEGPRVISFDDARALLATRGWKLEADTAGNWLLTPQGEPGPQSASQPVQKQADALARGAVRRIHQVFLVSIVGDSPPHRLQNQLAIRVEDGRVVPLLGD